MSVYQVHAGPSPELRYSQRQDPQAQNPNGPGVGGCIHCRVGWLGMALGGIDGPGWLREREALGGGGVQGTRDVELRCDAAISNWIECEVGVKQELVSIQSAKTGRG